MSTNLLSTTVTTNQAATANQYNLLRKDILQNAGDYAATTGSTNAYVLAIDSQISAYAEGLVFKFKANFANTGPATLNVNSIGAKTIKKNGSSDLVANDILNGQMVVVQYDNTNLQLLSGFNNPQTQLKKTFTAGENITAGQPVAVVPKPTTTSSLASQASQDNEDIIYGNNWSGQTFLTTSTVKIDSVVVDLAKQGTVTGFTITVSIYSVNGSNQPSNLIASTTLSATSITGSMVSTTFTFTNAFVMPNTTFAFVISMNNGDGSNYLRVHKNTSGGYASGGLITSANAGSTWSGPSGSVDLLFTVNHFAWDGTNVQIFKAKASANNYLFNGFIGFANAAITSGNPGEVAISGQDENQSGLSPGIEYYLSDTAGTIATTAGTNSKIVGTSISGTQLKIRN